VTVAEDALVACTLLLVDDEEANLDLLEALLESEGYTHLVRTADAREVLGLVERHAPDLVLLDLHMPHRHGLQLLADLRALTPPGAAGAPRRRPWASRRWSRRGGRR